MAQLTCPVVVGRERELEEGDTLLESALAGKGALVFVSGEPGVGKSRLALTIAARAADRGAAVLGGTCLEQLRSVPYWPAAELVRALLADAERAEAVARLGSIDARLLRLLPELDSPDGSLATDSALERNRLAIAVCALFEHEAETRPLVIVLEDLHWADAATVDLVPLLARRLRRRPTLVLATYRSDEAIARRDLVDALADLRGQRLCTDMELSPFDPNEVEEMIRATLGISGPISADFIDAIRARSDGNPFFIEELLRTLVEAGAVFQRAGTWDRKTIDELEIPPTIQEAILRRVRRLPRDAQALVQLASVLGDPFDLGTLELLAGLSTEATIAAAHTLVEQQLLVEEPASGRFRFRHALTRDTVYRQPLVAERRLLHRQVASALERMHADRPDEHAGELAYHFQAAGEPNRARELAVRAAARAAALGALVDARTHYDTALRLTSEPMDRAPLLLVSAQLSHVLGDLPTAIADLSEAASIAQASGDRRAQARAVIELSGATLIHGDRTSALRLRHFALDLLKDEGECEELVWAYRALGHHHILGSSYAEAVAWSERAIELGRRLGIERAVIEATIDLATSLPDVGEPERGFALLREILMRARQRGLTTGDGRAAVNLSHILVLAGRYEEAIAVCREGMALCEQFEQELDRRICQVNLAGSLRLVGRWDEAEAELDDLAMAAARTESRKYALMALEELGLLRADQGRWDEARELRDKLEPLVLDRAELQHVAQLRMLSARVAAACGDTDGALAELDDLRRYWREHTDDVTMIIPALALGVEHASALGDEAGATERWHELEQVARRSCSAEPPAVLEEARGYLSMRLGNAHAVASLARAATAWERLGRPYDQCRALRLTGETLLDAGELELAAARLDDALAIARTLGARDEIRLAERMLRRTGRRVARGPRVSTRFSPGGLTMRELEVARLVSEGRTNADIAAALVITRKTAAAHVSHILAKLGFSSRAQIARWIAEQAPAELPVGARER